MAMLIKNRARKALANSPVAAWIAPHGVGLVFDPIKPERSNLPVVSLAIGDYCFHITVDEFNRALAKLRNAEAEYGVKIE